MKRRLLSLTSAFRMLHFLLKCETAVSWEEERQPTPYPISFRIPFFTNVSDDSDDRATVSGMLYYDWTIRSQRVDHGAGSYECVHFYNALDEPCSLFFTPSGMYRVLPDNNKTTLPCCLDLPDIGAPAPTWAESANGSYHGMVYEEYSERLAYQWTFNQVDSRNLVVDRSSAFHTALEVAEGSYTGRPLTFTFPGRAQGRQDYHFTVELMYIGPLAKSIFDLPDNCARTLCQDSSTLG
jgi:hypothetical protein